MKTAVAYNTFPIRIYREVDTMHGLGDDALGDDAARVVMMRRISPVSSLSLLSLTAKGLRVFGVG